MVAGYVSTVEGGIVCILLKRRKTSISSKDLTTFCFCGYFVIHYRGFCFEKCGGYNARRTENVSGTDGKYCSRYCFGSDYQFTGL